MSMVQIKKIDATDTLNAGRQKINTAIDALVNSEGNTVNVGFNESFDTLADLKAKYPSGASGMFFVFNNGNSDGGHSYMWVDDIWKDLGIYQGKELGDSSVKSNHLTSGVVSLNKIDEEIQNDISDFESISITPENKNYIVEEGMAIEGGSQYFSSVIIPATAGDRFLVTLMTGGTNTPSIIYTRDDMTVLGTDLFPGNGSNIKYELYGLKCPSGTTKLIINSFSTTAIAVKKRKYKSIATQVYVKGYQIPLNNTTIAEPDMNFEIGSISSAQGANVDSTNRIRNIDKIFIRKGSVINLIDDFVGNVMVYNNDDLKSYKSSIIPSGVGTISNYIVTDDCYIRAIINYSDSRELTIADVAVLKGALQVRFNADFSELYSRKKFDIQQLPFMKTNIELEYGSVSSTTGQNIVNTTLTRVRSDYIFFPKGSVVTTDTSKCRIAILMYDVDTKEFLGSAINDGVNIHERYTATNDMIVKFVFSNLSATQVIPDISIMYNFFEILLGQTYSYLSKEINQFKNTGGLVEISKLGYKLEKVLNISGLSDHTFVGDELWVFQASEDTNTEYKSIYRYRINFDDLTFTTLSPIEHNLGHCNTVDYCEENDTIIMGNGSSDYEATGKIYIIPNVKTSISNRARISLDNDVIVIDCEEYSLGKKFNLVWGDGGLGTYDNCFLITDDTSVIRKLQLGIGSNNLGMGTLLPDKSESEYNGTFKVIETHKQESRGYDDVIQGGQLYKNILYTNIGHYGINWWENTLLNDGLIKRKNILNIPYDATGADIGATYYSIGIAIKNDYLFYGTKDKMLVYKI